MILSLSTVLNRVELHQTINKNVVGIPWDEWGPRNTHFLQTSEVISSWPRRTFGQAIVTWEPQPQTMKYYNFNQQALKHDSLSTPDEDHELLETSTADGEMFDRPVVTSLPCRVKSVVLPRRGEGRRYSSIMLGEDALIGISVGFRLSFSCLSSLPHINLHRDLAWVFMHSLFSMLCACLDSAGLHGI